MELTRFHQCVDDEFGHDYGTWILRSHVLSEYGKTSNELLVILTCRKNAG